MTFIRRALGITVGLVAIFSTITSLTAGETGIAVIHAWHQVGKKTCIESHWHYGSASGRATRNEAEAAAISVWVNFTAVDYGTDWMSYKLAESRKSNCERSADTWSCVVEARACKLTKGAPRATAQKH